MPAPLTDEWIEEQLTICEKATQGQWYDGFDDGSGRIGNRDGAYITLTETPHLDERFPTVIVGGDYEGIPIGVLKQDDVDFIIAARAGYLLVLKEVQRLRQVIHSIVSELG